MQPRLVLPPLLIPDVQLVLTSAVSPSMAEQISAVEDISLSADHARHTRISINMTVDYGTRGDGDNPAPQNVSQVGSTTSDNHAAHNASHSLLSQCNGVCLRRSLFQTAFSSLAIGARYAIDAYEAHERCSKDDFCPDAINSAIIGVAGNTATRLAVDYDNCNNTCIISSLDVASCRAALHAMVSITLVNMGLKQRREGGYHSQDVKAIRYVPLPASGNDPSRIKAHCATKKQANTHMEMWGKASTPCEAQSALPKECMKGGGHLTRELRFRIIATR